MNLQQARCKYLFYMANNSLSTAEHRYRAIAARVMQLGSAGGPVGLLGSPCAASMHHHF